MLFPARRRWLSPAWLAAPAAVVLFAVGAFVYSGHHGRQSIASIAGGFATHSSALATDAQADDLELLGQISPGARASYADNLQTVNAFIRDAENSVAQNPDDDDARHFLMDAYQQRAMVYELAMDRTMQQ
jgi:hypothetical protein